MRESVCIISSQRPDKYPNGGDEAYWTAWIAPVSYTHLTLPTTPYV